MASRIRRSRQTMTAICLREAANLLRRGQKNLRPKDQIEAGLEGDEKVDEEWDVCEMVQLGDD